MHRHLSTGSATLSALMGTQRGEPDPTPRYDLFRLLAEMSDRSHRRTAARPPTVRREETAAGDVD